MPFRKMTIMLNDVNTLFDIPVVGNIVSLHLEKKAQALLSRALGVTVEEAYKELRSACGCSVKLEWLRLRFQEVTDNSGKEVIKCSVRAYLLYLLEWTLFTDKIASWVLVNYLHYLENLNNVHTYA